MPTYHVQVSAHGAWDEVSMTLADPDTQYRFFVKAGETLDYQKSIQIYDWLAANDLTSVNHEVVNIYYGPTDIPDYALWNLNDPGYVSGVLLAGQLVPLVDIPTTVTEYQPVYLSTVMAQVVAALGIVVGVDELIVYFNACRT